MKRTIVAGAAVALPLAALFWSSGAVAPHTAFAALGIIVVVVLAAGKLLLRAAHAEDLPEPAAWVAGIFATAMALFALVTAFHVLAATAFAIWAVAVLGALFALRAPLPPAPAPRGGLVALLLCGAATMAWCHELAAVPEIFAREGALKTWTDQFIHGTVISQFGDPRAAGHQAIELAGLAAPSYHYASYMLPAALAWPLDLPGLTLATSVWTPLGFFTLCAAVYALGDALGGRAAGVAALVALTLVPDAASYGLYNRLFGYYWYVIAVPGASYGIALALLAIVFLDRWMTTRDLRALAAGASVVTGLFLVRVHIFLLAFPVWLTTAAFSLPAVQRRKLPYLCAAAAGFGLFVWAFYALLPQTVPALWAFLDNLHNQQHPTAYRGLYEGAMRFYGSDVALLLGLLLVFPACLGIFLILYPLSVALARRVRPLRGIDLVPVAMLVWYLLLILSAPIPPDGDATELTQRPFVLLYAVFAIWTAAGFAVWLESLGGLRARNVRLSLIAATAASVIGVLFLTVKDWRWAYEYQAAEGLPRAASFIRGNWRRGDVIAVEGLKTGLITTDAAIQLVSLTGVPAYLARPFYFLHVTDKAHHAEVAAARYAALEAVAQEKSIDAALRRLRDLGVQWYVVAESDRRGPRWDPERRRAAFVEGMVAVYSAGQAGR
jgi:hypothetical protein